MSAQDFNILFVIWRESIEALLIIGILSAWIGRRSDVERKTGRLWLWSGVGVGLLAAGALSAALLTVGDMLDEEAQEYFQTFIVLLASGLIVQMVFWMRANARTLKADLHASLDRAAAKANWFGVFILAAIAVLREGSEAAVFLYGTMATVSANTLSAVLAAGLGILAAIASYGLLQLGSKVLSWRTFFRITEVMLLFLAAALLISGLDHLISLGVVPPLSSRIWDTSGLLSDTSVTGRFVSGLTGYRARPDLIQVLVFAGYWLAIIAAMYRPRKVAPA